MTTKVITDMQFKGILTPELREFIRNRRHTLGVTLQQLSSLLRVSWSTLRKWEDGTITRCHRGHICRLAKFLAGDYDEELRRLSEPVDPLQPRHHGRLSPMLAWMERAANLYRFCENYPAIGNEMINNIRAVVDVEVRKLMQKPAGSARMSALHISPEQEID